MIVSGSGVFSPSLEKDGVGDEVPFRALKPPVLPKPSNKLRPDKPERALAGDWEKVVDRAAVIFSR